MDKDTHFTEEIMIDKDKQCLSHAEAALLLHDAYEKKMDTLERRRQTLTLNE